MDNKDYQSSGMAYACVAAIFFSLTIFGMKGCEKEDDYQEAKAKAYQVEFNNGSDRDLVVRQSNSGDKLGVAR